MTCFRSPKDVLSKYRLKYDNIYKGREEVVYKGFGFTEKFINNSYIIRKLKYQNATNYKYAKRGYCNSRPFFI